jgi:carbon storage regulator
MIPTATKNRTVPYRGRRCLRRSRSFGIAGRKAIQASRGFSVDFAYRHQVCLRKGRLSRKQAGPTVPESWRIVMLVLTRKPGEKIIIGDNITITVVEAIGNKIRIGIEAPDDVRILRSELACWDDEPATSRRHGHLSTCCK